MAQQTGKRLLRVTSAVDVKSMSWPGSRRSSNSRTSRKLATEVTATFSGEQKEKRDDCFSVSPNGWMPPEECSILYNLMNIDVRHHNGNRFTFTNEIGMVSTIGPRESDWAEGIGAGKPYSQYFLRGNCDPLTFTKFNPARTTAI